MLIAVRGIGYGAAVRPVGDPRDIAVLVPWRPGQVDAVGGHVECFLRGLTPSGGLLQVMHFVEHDQGGTAGDVLAVQCPLLVHLAVGHDHTVGVPRPRPIAVAVITFDVQAQLISRPRPLTLDMRGRCNDDDLLDAPGLDKLPGGVHRPEGLARARHCHQQVVLLQLAEVIRLYRELPPKRPPFGHPGSFSEVAWRAERLPVGYVRPAAPGERGHMIGMPGRLEFPAALAALAVGSEIQGNALAAVEPAPFTHVLAARSGRAASRLSARLRRSGVVVSVRHLADHAGDCLPRCPAEPPASQRGAARGQGRLPPGAGVLALVPGRGSAALSPGPGRTGDPPRLRERWGRGSTAGAGAWGRAAGHVRASWPRPWSWPSQSPSCRGMTSTGPRTYAVTGRPFWLTALQKSVSCVTCGSSRAGRPVPSARAGW